MGQERISGKKHESSGDGASAADGMLHTSGHVTCVNAAHIRLV